MNIISDMEYCFTKGFKGGDLLYLQDEKNLFVRKKVENGEETYICYQSVLAKRNKEVANCTARVKLNGDKECTRNKISHTTHEILFRDFESLNVIRKNCRMLRRIIPITSHKISVKEIFLQEMAK